MELASLRVLGGLHSPIWLVGKLASPLALAEAAAANFQHLRFAQQPPILPINRASLRHGGPQSLASESVLPDPFSVLVSPPLTRHCIS